MRFGRCEEYVYGDGKGGARCSFTARYRVVNRVGRVLQVCGVHRRALLNAGWNSASPIPDQGEVTL